MKTPMPIANGLARRRRRLRCAAPRTRGEERRSSMRANVIRRLHSAMHASSNMRTRRLRALRQPVQATDPHGAGHSPSSRAGAAVMAAGARSRHRLAGSQASRPSRASRAAICCRARIAHRGRAPRSSADTLHRRRAGGVPRADPTSSAAPAGIRSASGTSCPASAIASAISIATWCSTAAASTPSPRSAHAALPTSSGGRRRLRRPRDRGPGRRAAGHAGREPAADLVVEVLALLRPRPPCFARATIAALDGRRWLLIGGTASIVGEDSCHPDNLEAQLDETFANLCALIESVTPRRADPLSLVEDVRVYIARPEHAAEIAEAVHRRFTGAREIELALADGLPARAAGRNRSARLPHTSASVTLPAATVRPSAVTSPSIL